MNRRSRQGIAVAIAAIAAAATVAAVVGQVSGGSYGLWWRSTSGGVESSGGPYQVRAAIGQPLTGSSAGGSFALTSGFYPGAGQGKHYRYLPQLASDGTD